jgi:L-asparagine transporter-like permease
MLAREEGLSRDLTAGRQAMMAMGGVIGTGLFLGSGIAVGVAGPAVILSYVIGAAIAAMLATALTEMCVAHPAAGSFGVQAEHYLSPFGGFAVRTSFCVLHWIATGGHMVAIAIYMRYWFPDIPSPIWIMGFAVGLLYVNARAVRTLGEFQYWFVWVKVSALIMFVVLAAAVLVGWVGDQAPGLTNYTAHGGFMPGGLVGIWLGAAIAFYAFMGCENVAVSSGESRDPRTAIPRAHIRLVGGVAVLYVATMALMVGIMPWNRAGVAESPFVTVLGWSGIPFAAAVMNVVVLSAALSAANDNFYIISRMLFSLSRSGYLPDSIGVLNTRQVPFNALLLAGSTLAVPVVVGALWPNSAYVWFLGVSLFGGMLVWVTIFLTHLRFRQHWDAPGAAPLPVRIPWARWTSGLGAILTLAVLVSTWWVPNLKITLLVAIPWLLILALGYRATRRGAVSQGRREPTG